VKENKKQKEKEKPGGVFGAVHSTRSGAFCVLRDFDKTLHLFFQLIFLLLLSLKKKVGGFLFRSFVFWLSK
jgi:hypothetical protein